MPLTKAFPLALTAMLAGAACAQAAEWSHITGPTGDRKSTETVRAEWQGGKPRQLWNIPAVGGFSSFVTGGGKVFTVVSDRGRESAVALDRKTGARVWQASFNSVDYRNGGDRGVPGNDGGDGPRITPVYADGKVFVFGGLFDLYALNADSGRELWKRDLIREFGGDEIEWSNAAAPIVMKDRVIVSGGGRGQAFIAFRVDNGEVIWKSGSDRATHATPVLATIHGKQQALFRTERGLVSIDPENGKELWHYPFPHRTATAPSAVAWNDIVFCSSGYGVGGGACQVKRTGDKWEVEELWRSPGNRDSAAHWGTSVVVDGFLYGCYGHNEYGSGAFKCIDIRTGKVMWQQSGFGHGQVILAGNRLVATTDAGVLTIIEPTSTAYKEVAKADIIDGKVWASPALSDGQLFLRSTTKGVCVEL
jgi:outer membrane protein assembly factor BamB